MKNKSCVIVGVSGGIAAYKAAQLVSNLKKKEMNVHVVMTHNATEFVSALTFETLSGNRVSVDTFDRNFEYNVEHVSLAKQADCFVIVPATANVIAKIVHGLADDMLTTTFLACRCPKILCPAMNTAMLENEVTQENFKKATQLGYKIINSEEGYLACGDTGKGRLTDLFVIEEAIEIALQTEKFLAGKKVLITAGGTQEAIDPVRYITNHSSGKMGYALAHQAVQLGAEVTLISANSMLTIPSQVHYISTVSAQAMFEAVKVCSKDQDIIIKAAAVADYTPQKIADHKIKKSGDDLVLELKRTEDILAWLGKNKQPNQFLCGFAMETENVIENAEKKRSRKQVDMIVANCLTEPGAGFQKDTNRVTLITKDQIRELPLLSKDEVALWILKVIAGKEEV